MRLSSSASSFSSSSSSADDDDPQGAQAAEAAAAAATTTTAATAPTPTPTPTPTSWIGYKELGGRLYERGEYDRALAAYRSALSPEYDCPLQERQLLLSNSVACRLKIGGRPQAEAALADARKCVAINPSWSKGHVRLAASAVALGGRSNEACNSLQAALRCDPGNRTARDMLVRELRRDHATASASRANSSRSSQDDGDGRDDRQQTPPSHNPGHVPPPARQEDRNRQEDYDGPDDDAIDDASAVTFRDRVAFATGRARIWYGGRSDSTKTMLKLAMGLVALYVAFGGRFGLEYFLGGGGSASSSAGNYGSNSAYDRYRHGHRATTGYSSSSSSSSSYPYDDNNSGSRGSSYDPHYGGGGGGRRQRNRYGGGGSSSWSSALGGGSLQSVALLAGAAFLCHRMGINPMHALLLLNVAGGGRRRGGLGGGFRRGPRMYGGGGGGMGGMRYGGRRRY